MKAVTTVFTIVFLLKTLTVVTSSFQNTPLAVEFIGPLGNDCFGNSNIDCTKMFGDRSVGYIKCGEKKPFDCNVTLTTFYTKTLPFVHTYRCPMNVTEVENNNLNTTYIQSIIDKKLVFLYSRKTHKKSRAEFVLREIDMVTCAYKDKKSFGTQAQEFLKISNFRAYADNTYDIFLAAQDICSGKRCKLTLDSDGKVLSHPVSYLNGGNFSVDLDVEVFPVAREASPKSYFFVLRHDLPCTQKDPLAFEKLTESEKNLYLDEKCVLTVMHADDEGNQTELLRVDDEDKRYGNLYYIGSAIYMDYDDSNGHFGICWVIKDLASVRCVQYDKKAKKVLDQVVDLTRNVMRLEIKNSQKDGILLLVAFCNVTNSFNNNDCLLREDDLLLKHIKPNGHHEAEMKIPLRECDPVIQDWSKGNLPQFKIEEVGSDFLCFNIVCPVEEIDKRTDGRSPSLKILDKCFSSNFFDV